MRLIDADALMGRVVYRKSSLSDKRIADGYNQAVGICRSMIYNAPTIEAEPMRHGEWIYHHAAPEGWKVCSVCLEKAHHPAGGDPYCHNCGAIMDGGSGA